MVPPARILIIVILAALILMPAAHAAALESLDVEVLIENDGTSSWSVTFDYNGSAERSDFFIQADVADVRVSSGGEPVDFRLAKHELGNNIIIDELGKDSVTYEFTALGLVSSAATYKMFRYKFPIVSIVENFSFTAKLPLGSALVEPAKLIDTGLQPYSPSFGQQSSDGRRIFVEWNVKRPELGEDLDIHAIFEQAVDLTQVGIAVVVVFLLILVFFFLAFIRRSNVKSILPVLTDGERKVMEILLRQKGTVDQREVVRQANFSKSKVSRVIQNLEARGLVTRFRKGRANKIRVVHRVPQQAQQQPQKDKGEMEL